MPIYINPMLTMLKHRNHVGNVKFKCPRTSAASIPDVCYGQHMCDVLRAMFISASVRRLCSIASGQRDSTHAAAPLLKTGKLLEP